MAKSFPTEAREGNKHKASRRVSVREGASLAQRVRNALMQAWLERVESEAVNPLEIPREVLEATKQSQDAFESEFAEKKGGAKGNKPGLRTSMTPEEAEKALEE